MVKSSIGKIVSGLAAVTIVAAGSIALLNNRKFEDGGVDVNNTECSQIAAARQAVSAELEERKSAAGVVLADEREAASDAFWAENRRLEDAHHACLSQAATADPCKPAFEKVGMLYDQIMADFDVGNGFNEAKFQEREQAKKEYEECVQKAKNDEFYKADTAQCDADFASGQQANQKNRQAAEASAQAKYDEAVARAETAAKTKQGILDAIEEKCNEPADTTNIGVGGLTAGSTGTSISTGSACTGVFTGNDSDLDANLRRLESQLQKARAAGLREGLYGTDHLQSAVDEARQKLRDSQRTCTVDADCGDTAPVCCSNNEVGRVFCDGGVCSNEITTCDDPQVCAGSPAACVDPSTGAQSQPIEISRTIPEVGTCSLNLQNLNLQKAGEQSDRFEIMGFPNWVHADPPGGKLPVQSNLSYDCNTVQGFGPGTYTANGQITVYDTANNLINTIPIHISITVQPVGASDREIAVIDYNGKYIPVSQLKAVVGAECDKEEHWHPKEANVTATDGTVMSDPNPAGCGLGKTAQTPVMYISAGGQMDIRVEGLEGLKTR